MARPRTPVGTWGEITCTEKRRGQWLAEAWFRERNGRLPRVSASGKTKTAATNALKVKLAKRAEEVRRGIITTDTRLARVAEMWLAEVEKDAHAGATSWNTVKNFRTWTLHWIVPSCGELSMSELQADVGVIDSLLDRAMSRRGHGTASGVKTAFRLICEYAHRHGALLFNPVKLAKRLKSPARKPPRGLTREQRDDLMSKIDLFVEKRQVDRRGRKVWRSAGWTDLPDLCEAFMSTGVRAGELCALVAPNFDVRTKTIRIEAHIVPKPGEGPQRVPYRKGSTHILVLRVPDWSVPMWSRRALAAGDGPLFPALGGGWRSPSYLATRLKVAFTACGYEWLRSHSLGRKTVALAMAEAGRPVGDIANQLGNTEKVVQMHYLPPRPANDATMEALEQMR